MLKKSKAIVLKHETIYFIVQNHSFIFGNDFFIRKDSSK